MTSIAIRLAIAAFFLMAMGAGLAAGSAATDPAPAAHPQASATLPPGARLSERIYHLPGISADAETEMQSFGFNDVWINFRKFIKSYGAQLPKR